MDLDVFNRVRESSKTIKIFNFTPVLVGMKVELEEYNIINEGKQFINYETGLTQKGSTFYEKFVNEALSMCNVLEKHEENKMTANSVIIGENILIFDKYKICANVYFSPPMIDNCWIEILKDNVRIIKE